MEQKESPLVEPEKEKSPSRFRRAVEWVAGIVMDVRQFFRKLFHVCCDGHVAQVVTALVFALLTGVRMYIAENQQSNLREDALLFNVLERFNKAKEFELQDTAFFINVSRDLQLVYEDTNRPSEGYATITDRRKLFQFLQKVERDSIDYKYIMMDIRFEKKYETEYDDSLYAIIQRMPRIVIATHQKNDSGGDYEIADNRLLEKCGMSDYNQYGIVTNFSRYTFLQAGKPSMALKMYDDLNHQETSVKQWDNRPVYYTDGHLCINSPMMYLTGTVLNFEDYTMLQFAREQAQMQNGLETGMEAESAKLDDEQGSYYFYMNLGGDFVDNEFKRDLKWDGDLKDKIIIIANFEDDVHDTYVGKVAGAYITWMAYQYLCNGNHVLDWGFVLLNFLCYAFVFWFLLFMNGVMQKSKYAGNEKAQRWLSWLRWLGSFGLLLGLTFALYRFMQFRFNMAVPLLSITILNFVIQIANKYQKSS